MASFGECGVPLHLAAPLGLEVVASDRIQYLGQIALLDIKTEYKQITCKIELL